MNEITNKNREKLPSQINNSEVHILTQSVNPVLRLSSFSYFEERKQLSTSLKQSVYYNLVQSL